jgi:ABC-type enterochelin transport system substrate-binding protein
MRGIFLTPHGQPAVLMENNEKNYAEDIDKAAEMLAQIFVEMILEKRAKQKKRARRQTESTGTHINRF